MKDYYILKKKYGERFARLCRELFPTILDKEGLLSDLITSSFAENKFLYDDIIENDLSNSFKEFVLSKNQEGLVEENLVPIVVESPFELMKKARYKLVKCETDEDVKSFKKYWQPDEELCTFRDDERINNHIIFFAIKDNVDEIKRENFINPKRQDEYGTSVISLQFTKQTPNMLSIKNRYNHTVASCDATFSNDPENIIAGLTDAFVNEYDLDFTVSNDGFELPEYALSNDGKYYKSNLEINNEYYCHNAIINQNREVIEIDGSRFILIDSYIVDTKLKRVLTYALYNKIKDKESVDLNKLDAEIAERKDAFIDSIGEISNIEITKNKEGRTITITPNEGENVIIDIDKNNAITGYTNANVTKIGDNFLCKNKKMRILNLTNVIEAGDRLMCDNEELEEVEFSSLKTIGDYAFLNNKNIKKINFSSLEKSGDKFLFKNEELEEANFPKIKKLGDHSFNRNRKIRILNMPNLIDGGESFLCENTELKEVYLLKLKKLCNYAFYRNKKITKVYCPSLELAGNELFFLNKSIKEWDFSALNEVGFRAFSYHKNRDEILSKVLKQGAFKQAPC